MSIRKFFNKTVNTQRLTAVSGSKRETWQTNLNNFNCAIQPIDPLQSELSDGSFYKLFKMYFNDKDILKGDRVVEGSNVYIVRGVNVVDYSRDSGQNHKVAILALTE